MTDDDSTRDHITYLMQYVSTLLTCLFTYSVVSLKVCFVVSSDHEFLCIVDLVAHGSVLMLLILCVFMMLYYASGGYGICYY